MMKKIKWLLLIVAVSCVFMILTACGNQDTTSIPGADERVVNAYDEGIAYYQENTDLKGYWSVFAAYAVLGDEIQNGSYTYDSSGETTEQPGAVILGLIMMGENPYDYNGEDLMSALSTEEVSGGFAIPVFKFLALQAAGTAIDEETEAAYVTYCCEQLTTLALGPDIGGWSAVALIRYMDDPDYSDEIAAAVDGYVSVISENLVSGTMGSTGISAGCVVTGLTALTAAGFPGYDVTKDSPWIDEDPLAIMYDYLLNGEENVSSYYNSQYYMEFSDLYNVLYGDENMAWIRCGVNEEKLEDLIVKGEALVTENPADTALAEALDKAKQLTTEELSASVPAWGDVYYALFDAVKQYA